MSRTDRLEYVLEAVRTVMQGERYCSPEVASFLEETTGPLRITPEERRILELFSEGVLDTVVVAERLGVHPTVVLGYVNALRNKSRCFSREELAAWWRQIRPHLTPEGTLES